MLQYTREQAEEIYDNKEWEHWTDEQIVNIQLYQERLCMPFDKFHKAVENVLGRPVWTHEFAWSDYLREEYEGKRDRPAMEDIINLIPLEKLIIVEV